MSLDRNKALEASQKFQARGQLDKAIAELQRIVAVDPSDIRTLLRIADLQLKAGSTSESVDSFVRAADAYADQGFFAKSVAVYKQAAKLDPTRLDVLEKLASNCVDLQHTAEAVATYEQLAEAHLAAGNTEKGIEAMRRATELDPTNIGPRVIFAETLWRAKRTSEAESEFRSCATVLMQQGRVDEYIPIAERLLFLREGDLELAKELARLYLQRGEGMTAFKKLQLAFRANPKDTETLRLLADALLAVGQRAKAIQVLKELGKVYFEHKQMHDRTRVLERVLELDPNDGEARQALMSPVRPRIDVDAVVPASAVIGGGGRIGSPTRPLTLAGNAPYVPTPAARLASNHAPPGPLGGNAVSPSSAPHPNAALTSNARASANQTAAIPSLLRPSEPPQQAAPRSTPPAAVGPAATPASSMPAHSMPPPSAPAQASRASFAEIEVEDIGIEIDVDTELLEVEDFESDDIEATEELEAQEGSEQVELDDTARLALAAKSMVEARALERIGPRSKLIAHLEHIAAFAPVYLPARERLRDIYLDENRTDDAVDHMLAIAEALAETDRSRALSQLRQALLLDDENPDVRRLLRRLDPNAFPGRPKTIHAEPESEASTTEAPVRSPIESIAPVLFVDDDLESEIEVDVSVSDSVLESPVPELVQPAPQATPAATLDALRALADSEFPPAMPSLTAAPTPQIETPADDTLSPLAIEVEDIERESLLPPIPFDSLSDELPPRHSSIPPLARPFLGSTAPQAAPPFIDERASLPPIDELDLGSPADEALAEASSAPAPVEAVDAVKTIEAVETVKTIEAVEQTPSAASRPSRAPHAHVGDVLEEVDFYLAQSLFEEAREAVEDALASHPSHPLLLEKQNEIDELSRVGKSSSADIVAGAFGAFEALGLTPPSFESPSLPLATHSHDPDAPLPASAIIAAAVGSAMHVPAAVEAAPLEPSPVKAAPVVVAPADASNEDEGAFALAEKLAEALDDGADSLGADSLGADSIDVDLVFQQFKRGVERQVDESDTETHYDLGIAYKEMGLLDDAIGEFEIAARSTSRASVALTMVGHCRLEQGRTDEAIAALERGLSMASDARQQVGVRFELGSALALANRDAEALEQLEEVRRIDPGFRGVNEKLAQLRSRIPAADGASEDDLERAFEDLLGQ